MHIFKDKVLTGFLVLVIFSAGVVFFISTVISSSQSDLDEIIHPLELYKQGEDIIKREFYYLTTVKDRTTWEKARANSMMDVNLKPIIYGTKPEDFKLFLGGFELVEVLHTFNSSDSYNESEYIARIKKGKVTHSMYIKISEGVLVSLSVY